MLTGVTYKFRLWSRSWPVIFTKPQIEIVRWIYNCKRLKCFMIELFLWFKESMWINLFSQVFIWKPCPLNQSRWPVWKFLWTCKMLIWPNLGQTLSIDRPLFWASCNLSWVVTTFVFSAHPTLWFTVCLFVFFVSQYPSRDIWNILLFVFS